MTLMAIRVMEFQSGDTKLVRFSENFSIFSNRMMAWSEIQLCYMVKDIHIVCSKQFKWNLYFYVSGQSGPFLAVLKLLLNSNMNFKYRKVASRSTCYYLENQVFGDTANQGMSLNKTKVSIVSIAKSFFAWISNPALLGFQQSASALLLIKFKFG